LNVLTLTAYGLLIWAGSADAAISYLDNGVLKIGIDTNRGGTITYLAKLSDGRDIINSFDLGRMVQQSYYSGPVPFGTPHPSYSNWGWNAVAAGDVYGYRSAVLEQTNDGTTIYVKRIPKQWALSNVDSESTMEEWITLEGNVAKVRCRLNNNRSTPAFYGGYSQELPALYANPPFKRIVAYTGSSPFTNGALTQIIHAGPPWTSFLATESWSALVDTADWGVGLYHPNVQYTLGGTAGTGSVPEGYTTGYLSPVFTEHIDHNIVYDYEYYLIVGSLAEIRSYVYAHQPPTLPHWHFQKDRQHWAYLYTTDSGYPIEGKLHVNLNSTDPAMTSSAWIWNAADVPKLYVRARSSAANASAQMFWQNLTDAGFGGKSMYFFLIPDGQYHTYAVDLALSSSYTGTIKQIRFDPVSGGTAGEYLDIDYISAYPFPGDFNRDENVDFGDFATLASHWAQDRSAGFVGDLDGDRKVDLNDLSVFAAYWLKTTENHTKARWKFDETNGLVAADETGVHPGQLINFPSDNSPWIPDRSGVGGALRFDGLNDYVSVAHHSSLDITNCITIAAWVKLNNLNTYYFIATKQPSGTAGNGYPGNFEFRIAPGGRLEFMHQIDLQGTYQPPYASSGTITAGTWTHVAVTLVRGNYVRFYINGTTSSYASQSGSFGILNGEPVRIGTRKDTYTFFNGAMDDVRIYDRALNDEEIGALAQ
jgi:hypothetical protein